MRPWLRRLTVMLCFSCFFRELWGDTSAAPTHKHHDKEKKKSQKISMRKKRQQGERRGCVGHVTDTAAAQEQAQANSPNQTTLKSGEKIVGGANPTNSTSMSCVCQFFASLTHTQLTTPPLPRCSVSSVRQCSCRQTLISRLLCCAVPLTALLVRCHVMCNEFSKKTFFFFPQLSFSLARSPRSVSAWCSVRFVVLRRICTSVLGLPAQLFVSCLGHLSCCLTCFFPSQFVRR